MRALYLNLLLILLIGLADFAWGQDVSEDCNLSIPITSSSAYCSAEGEYSNENSAKAAWFSFIATAFDANITVSGIGSGGSLPSPVITIYSDCAGTDLVGTGMTENNVTTLYKGGLIIGKTYYLKISGPNKATGTFKLCLNNYNPVVQPGQDCATASFLCSTQTISQAHVSGAGLNTDEAKGTCLAVSGQSSESNSAWYKWQAANDGTLVFTITPNNKHDDIDWVLFDLGANGDCPNVLPKNAIRCKAGYGVDNIDCPNDSIYYKTGLDFTETDFSEPPGCGQGQNGKLMFVTCQTGHYYALLINNFSSGNNGFTLAFTDQLGKAGTVEFAGPRPAISYTGLSDCSQFPLFAFTSVSANYSALKWSFGDGASISEATTEGPIVVSYATAGIKTITLEATGDGGCTVVASARITVGIKPPLPVITIDKNAYCLNDTVRLKATLLPGITYSWTGPNGFHSDSSTAVVPVTGNQVAGTYKLVTASFTCTSDTAYIDLPEPQATPVAAFHTDPASVDAQYGPVTIQFINDSFNAETYLWDFGDGATSTEQNPAHTYNRKGRFGVTLTASRDNSCAISTTKNNLVIIQNNSYIFIPNTFTPNGDGINDLFNITITNLKNYHIQIFSRWGQPLFEAKDILKSWDGTYHGQKVSFGVYYYIVDAVSSNDEPIKRSGYITVIR